MQAVKRMGTDKTKEYELKTQSRGQVGRGRRECAVALIAPRDLMLCRCPNSLRRSRRKRRPSSIEAMNGGVAPSSCVSWLQCYACAASIARGRSWEALLLHPSHRRTKKHVLAPDRACPASASVTVQCHKRAWSRISGISTSCIIHEAFAKDNVADQT